MRNLVIGASGQVGALLLEQLAAQAPALGTYCRHARPGLVPLDLRDHSAIGDLVEEARPATCYLAGAFTHVDEAERRPAECRAVNVEAVEQMAWILAKTGGRLVFFSTEHVFGDSREPRREEDPLAPQSVYARSKARAEEVVRELLPDTHLILRTSWVFGPDLQEKNFFYRVRNTLSGGRRLVVANDQYGQPTYAPDLAATAILLAGRGECGTFHVVGPQTYSRLLWAQAIARQLRLPANGIEGRPTAEMGRTAPRPLSVRLDRRKLLDFLDEDPIRPPLEGVRQLVREEASCLAA
jgi:dTDP-4-dehydrorhamnose reductase